MIGSNRTDTGKRDPRLRHPARPSVILSFHAVNWGTPSVILSLSKDLGNRAVREILRQEQDGKTYLEIIVAPQSVAISLRGRYYYRSGSTKTELTGISLNEFLLKKSGTTWDRVIDPGATMDDIDEDSVQRFLKDAAQSGRLPDPGTQSTAELLEKLRLSKAGQLTRAALILFGKDPGAFFHSLSVKLGRFATDTDIRFQEVIEANLIQALPEVLEQLDHKFFVKTITFEGIQRIETPPYPKAALREVFLNAMVHRRYSSSTVQARIYDDHMTIWNEGPLPHTIPVETLTGPHASVPRNPLIADICFKAGYIDSWGRGIQKISDACTDARLPKPKFEEAFGGVLVTLTPEVAPEVTAQVTGQVEMRAKPLSGNALRLISDALGLDAAQVTAQVTAQVEKLLTCADGTARARDELQTVTGLRHREHFRKAYMEPLVTSEWLEQTIPDKPRSSKQKYRLTEKGRAWLKLDRDGRAHD